MLSDSERHLNWVSLNCISFKSLLRKNFIEKLNWKMIVVRLLYKLCLLLPWWYWLPHGLRCDERVPRFDFFWHWKPISTHFEFSNSRIFCNFPSWSLQLFLWWVSMCVICVTFRPLSRRVKWIQIVGVYLLCVYMIKLITMRLSRFQTFWICQHFSVIHWFACGWIKSARHFVIA